jgi:hypothetical protein
VVTPTEAGLPDEVAGTPLLAMLSTVVLGPDTFLPASGLLSVGMVEDEDLECAQTVGGGSVAIELTDAEADDFGVRFLIPAPNRKLALLAEFSVPDGRVPELVDRIRALMRSFRWAA